MSRLIPAMVLVAIATSAPAQFGRKPAIRPMICDDEGILRWENDSTEVALFGVNYYTPCALDYANITRLEGDHEQAIRDDVAHFERMRLDALRLHVFDREISDEKGNLVENHHVELLDLLIHEAKRRGIYTVLTPIAWWGGGGGSETHGFSDIYTKAEMYTHPDALAAQAEYLKQFLQHENPHTGFTYADDPAIPVIEIMNEPIPAPGTDDDVIVAYIDMMHDAIRAAGCDKPVFHNGWGNRHEAVGRSKAEGCSFGWYPSGLVAGHMLTSNFLPRVNDYPSMRSEALAKKAKIVYEFDAADIPGSYMYPAMARAFRSGGAQIACQFQYDPMAVSPWNAGWQTHFLNLIYTPKQAVSFMIAAEAFRALPRLETYGETPDADRFGAFSVSFEDQRSEMVTDEVFIYSDTTETKPPKPKSLTFVAGCGSSPVVQYDGTGAYFLERVADRVWRLQVYPDCVWVDDPHKPVSLSRETARVYWRERQMTINLPDLGGTFQVVSPESDDVTRAAGGSFSITPGVYAVAPVKTRENYRLSPEFVAPPSSDGPTTVWHDPPLGVMEGAPLVIHATVAAATDPGAVTLHVQTEAGDEVTQLAMEPTAPYRYAAEIPADLTRRGTLTYCVSVDVDGEESVFPDSEARDAAGRFVKRDPVAVLRFSGDEPLPEMGVGGAEGQTADAEFVGGSREGSKAARFTATGFGRPPSATGSRWPTIGGGAQLAGYNVLRVRARSTEEGTSHVEVGCVQDDGAAYGYDVPLSPAFRDVRVPIRHMRGLWGTWQGQPQPEKLTEISLNFGSWLFPHAADQPHGLEVEEIAFEYQPD
ncbi:MAG TPA: cellulase family glycosylhydrolase, partial [Armatimonadota bacterium]|nr:cellulase family glycosylhydrolase [Armatimonadota bacterium]